MTPIDIAVGSGAPKPFLLNFRIQAKETPPDAVYDERRSLSVARSADALPLVKSKSALATQTKTKAKSETDDSD